MSQDRVNIARAADEDELAAAVDALVAAFDADPGWSAMLPDMRPRRSLLTAALSALVADAAPRDSLLIALVDGSVAGAVVAWKPFYHPSPLQAPRYVSAGATMLRTAPLSTVRLARRWRVLQKADPVEDPHWHLAELGVHPDAQHRGAGRALLEAVLHRVDDGGGATYLETSRPELVAWYGTFGFGVRKQLTLPGGAPVWTMWRSPSSAQRDAARPRSPKEEVADRKSQGKGDRRQPLDGGGGRTIIG